MNQPEHFDVLIVGAGISGLGAACHLRQRCPGKTFVLLEGRADFGGTWDLFRYPGIRSDSDMHTLGFSFKPWRAAKAIADGLAIKGYLGETIDEYQLAPHIRYGHSVVGASWSSETSRWTVRAVRQAPGREGNGNGAETAGEPVTFTCGFLSMCSGYYSYRQGYTPELPGLDRFRGPVIHPQEWPEDLDYYDKRVLVVGSGATAMTLVPALARDAAHVTMLQRSPTYVVSLPDRDAIANALRLILPDRIAYAITRWKNIRFQQYVYRQTRTKPAKVKKKLLDRVRKELPKGYDVAKHFTPRYDPWDQRLCLVPNSDLFEAIRSGKASVVTDHIESFVETGVRLRSGQELEADVVVTATGLDLVLLGAVEFVVDGEAVDFARTWTYRGLMYSDVPNLMSTFGYINASWTLRADLNAAYLCRLLQHMDESGTSRCTPRLRPSDAGMTPRPWIDGFSAGYIQRKLHLFPMQGDHEPWVHAQSYARDRKLLLAGPIEDGCLELSSPAARGESRVAVAEALSAAG